MIIYIYGSDSFKKDIHSVLKHSNIKFRLDEHGEIKELTTLDELKNAIEDNPSNIYLIDDAKIIKKNSLNQKIKFLKPKDGIEQEYLLDNGIGDISVDSIEELSKHIIKRLEALIHEKESSDIQDSIVEIVEEAYEQDEDDEKNFVQLDDELSALLSQKVDEPIVEQIDDITSLIEEIDIGVNEKEEVFPPELSFDEDFGNIGLVKEESPQHRKNADIEVNNQGVDMADEFSEFDTLNEADILAALDGLDEKEVSIQTSKKGVSTSSIKQANTESLDLGSSNVDDIAKLISQLLNNKTLEITVKVKD